MPLFEVTLAVSYNVVTTVTAKDEDEAGEIACSMYDEDGPEMIGHVQHPHDVDVDEVEEVEADND